MPRQPPSPARRLHRCSLGAGPERPALMPSEGVLALHELPALLQQGALLNDCLTVTRALGILAPLTGEHIPPEALLIQGPNWRESLVGNRLLSRNRTVLQVLFGMGSARNRKGVEPGEWAGPLSPSAHGAGGNLTTCSRNDA